MTPDQIQQIIDTLLRTGEFLATKAFELALRQVYVYATLDILIGAILILVGAFVLNHFRKNPEIFIGDGEFKFFMYGLVSIFPMLGIGLWVSSVKFFMNPEWYAVKLLLENFIK